MCLWVEGTPVHVQGLHGAFSDTLTTLNSSCFIPGHQLPEILLVYLIKDLFMSLKKFKFVSFFLRLLNKESKPGRVGTKKKYLLGVQDCGL